MDHDSILDIVQLEFASFLRLFSLINSLDMLQLMFSVRTILNNGLKFLNHLQ